MINSELNFLFIEAKLISVPKLGAIFAGYAFLTKETLILLPVFDDEMVQKEDLIDDISFFPKDLGDYIQEIEKYNSIEELKKFFMDLANYIRLPLIHDINKMKKIKVKGARNYKGILFRESFSKNIFVVPTSVNDLSKLIKYLDIRN